MAFRTLSIGGATFDLFVQADTMETETVRGIRSFTLPLGGKQRIDRVTSTFGGGANNTSVGLSRLGCSAQFCGTLGDDQWGEAIRNNMQRENVDLSLATIVENEPSSFSVILLAKEGERSILTHKGMDRHFSDVTFERSAVESVDAVYLSHLHPDSSEITDDLVETLTHTPGIHLTWNPGGAAIENGMGEKNTKLLLPHTDLLQLNKEEVTVFTGKKTMVEAFHVLKDAGVGIIVITDGKNGAFATDGKNLYTCPTTDSPVVDTTGAGDAFGVGVTWAILSGRDLPIALKTGTIQAESVVGAVGAQAGLLTETQITSKLERTDLPVTVERF